MPAVRFCRGRAFGTHSFVRKERCEFQLFRPARPRGLDGDFWSLTAEPCGASQDASGTRSYVLNVSGEVLEDRLAVHWTYSGNLHESSTVESLASDLRRIARADCPLPFAGCGRPHAFGRSGDGFGSGGLGRIVFRLAAISGQSVRAAESVYPLTPLQEGLLFHSLYNPSGAYVVQVCFDSRGCGRRLVAERVGLGDRASWDFATSFVWEGRERALQGCLGAAPRFPGARGLARGFRRRSAPARWDRYVAADRRRGFSLESAPLAASALIRTGDRSHRLLWSVHHLLVDGWSMSRILSEVGRLYSSLCRGGRALLPDSRPFRDYVSWLRAVRTVRRRSGFGVKCCVDSNRARRSESAVRDRLRKTAKKNTKRASIFCRSGRRGRWNRSPAASG